MRTLSAFFIALGILASHFALAVDVEHNWALHGKATQSSTALGGDAQRAIDGVTDGNWISGSVTHTNEEIDPYWQIDLGASYYIDEVRIYNRTDCCKERLHDYIVFFSNSKAGFQHRDLNSTLGENTTTDAATQVFAKAVIGPSGDINPITKIRGARQTVTITGNDCPTYNLTGQGCLVRFLRIQMAGTATLSLAEVQIIEKGSIPGPAGIADAVAWKPTSVVTDGNGAALVATDQHLLLFHRGSDKQLHASVDLNTGPAISGGGEISLDAPAAAWVPDGSGNRVFVAARRSSGVAVMEGAESDGNIGSHTWKTLGQTRTSPGLAIACRHAVVAWLDGSRIMTSWKPLDGPTAAWSAPIAVATGKTPPSLAANVDNAVGLGFLASDGSIGFTQARCEFGRVQWSTLTRLLGKGLGDRVSLAAYGPHFLLATMGGDHRAYLATQHAGQTGEEEWQGFEPIPASSMGDPGLPLAEAPRLFVMGGAIVAIARESAGGKTLYWVKFPNQMTPGDTWVGGRPLNGLTTSGPLTSMTALGQFALYGGWGAPAELYLAMRGSGTDHTVYAMNLGRFIAVDVMQHDLHISVEGMINNNKNQQPDRSLDPTIAPNLFEQMVTLLALPSPDRSAILGRKCGNPPLSLATFLELDRDFGSGQQWSNCPFEVIEGTTLNAAPNIYHEWLHVDSMARNLLAVPGYAGAFKYSDTSLNPADSGMKACTTSQDCGGNPCEHGSDNAIPGMFNSTKGAADNETTIRRWDNTQVCVVYDGPDGRRYQGGLRWYDVGTFDHAFIHMMIAYRWYGDDLRDWAAEDHDHGNDQLQKRYDWLRTTIFGGVEYNGRLDSGGHLPQSDRSLGYFGMPSR